MRAASVEPEPEPEPQPQCGGQQAAHRPTPHITHTPPPLEPPPPKAWPDRPVLVQLDSSVHRVGGRLPEAGASRQPAAPPQLLRVGQAFPLISELFEGWAVVRVRGVNERDDSTYFAGRDRRMMFRVYGRFLQRMRCSDVMSGQDFSHRLGRLPPQVFVRPVVAALRWMCPQLSLDISGAAPYLLTPLASTAQALAVHQPPAPDNQVAEVHHRLMGSEANEETRLLGGVFVVDPPSPAERKSIFNRAFAEESSTDGNRRGPSRTGNEAEHWFEPSLRYTFDFFSHVLDMVSMQAFGFDVAPILNQQPIVCMAKLRTHAAPGSADKYRWRIQLWHERTVPSVA
jgi:hypothetical protein